MALNVEIGSPDSEAYISIEEANNYINKWHASALIWSSTGNTNKERALRMGTRYVDTKKFYGYRTNEDQALAWPRVIPGWIDGQIVDSDEIPDGVKGATVEAAIRHLKDEDLFPDHNGGDIKSESSTLGPISESTTYVGSKSPKKTFEAVEALLRPFMRSGQGKTIARAYG